MCKLCMLYSGSAQAPAEPSSVPSDARQAAAQPTENGTAAVHTGEQAETEIATTSLADGQAVADGANTPAKDQLSSQNLAASKGQVMPACSLLLHCRTAACLACISYILGTTSDRS